MRRADCCPRRYPADGTAPDPDGPGVVARPPRIYLAFTALGLALHWLRPVALLPAGTPPALGYAAGGVLAGLGVAIMAIAVRQFRRAGTNVETPKPATALVTDGLYRWSRNPMYLSLTLIYAGVAAAANSLWLAALLLPLLAVMRYGVIAREERYLAGKFGGGYHAYTTSVRRWL